MPFKWKLNHPSELSKIGRYEGHLCLRCKKSLNLRFGRTKFSCYDHGAEFSFDMRRNIYTFDYKTVWLI